MKFALLKFVSVTGILFLFTVAAHAQAANGVPPSTKFAPPSEPVAAPPAADGSKKEDPKLTDREKALLDRIDQLEKRLADVEGLVKKPTAEAVTTGSTKTQTELASNAAPATPLVQPAV